MRKTLNVSLWPPCACSLVSTNACVRAQTHTYSHTPHKHIPHPPHPCLYKLQLVFESLTPMPLPPPLPLLTCSVCYSSGGKSTTGLRYCLKAFRSVETANVLADFKHIYLVVTRIMSLSPHVRSNIHVCKNEVLTLKGIRDSLFWAQI